MTLEQFEKEFNETIGKMSKLELTAAMERAGCKPECNDDNDQQTDYKTA